MGVFGSFQGRYEKDLAMIYKNIVHHHLVTFCREYNIVKHFMQCLFLQEKKIILAGKYNTIKDKGKEFIDKWEDKSKEFIGNFLEMFGKDGRIVSVVIKRDF